MWTLEFDTRLTKKIYISTLATPDEKDDTYQDTELRQLREICKSTTVEALRTFVWHMT